MARKSDHGTYVIYLDEVYIQISKTKLHVFFYAKKRRKFYAKKPISKNDFCSTNSNNHSAWLRIL